MAAAMSEAGSPQVDELMAGYTQSMDGEEMLVPGAAAAGGGGGGRPPVLSRLESTVAFAVLDLLQERLKLLGVVTVDASTQAQELSRSVGEEISRVMEEQKVLEERFENLIQVRPRGRERGRERETHTHAEREVQRRKEVREGTRTHSSDN